MRYLVSAFVVTLFFSAGACSVPGEKMVADFDKKDMKTLYGKSMGTWKIDPEDDSQWCNVSYVPDSSPDSSGSHLKVDYNVASAKAHFLQYTDNGRVVSSGYRSKGLSGFSVDLGGLDLSWYRYFAFSAKGDREVGFSKSFIIEMTDGERGASVHFDELTSEWRRYYIPLRRYASAINLNQVLRVVFVFNDGIDRLRGSMFLDDLAFSRNRRKKSGKWKVQ